MANKFYRWKDADCKGENPEWIEISGQEFYDYADSSKNTKRYFIKEYFVPEDVEQGFYEYEVTKECYDEWHKLYMRKRRYKLRQMKIGYGTISLDENFDENEEMSLHEAIADDSVNVEESAILAYRVNKIYEAIKLLPQEEADLIYCLFLRNPVMTVRAYAEKISVPKSTVQVKKASILLKLKEIIEKI